MKILKLLLGTCQTEFVTPLGGFKFTLIDGLPEVNRTIFSGHD